jgi:hypothetical protein
MVLAAALLVGAAATPDTGIPTMCDRIGCHAQAVTAVDGVWVPADGLRRGDVIVLHPHHLGRAVRYRVAVRSRVDRAVVIDYSPITNDGEATGAGRGVLVLRPGQPCAVRPAGEQVGASGATEAPSPNGRKEP